MSSLKFYVLTCRNLFALKRHEKIIPKEDLCIIINTQNSTYEAEAVSYCQTAGIEYHVTASDGTAATGKNSFCDIFEASTNDYAVLIDGDDFITPHGVWTYKQVAAMPTPPDVVALEYQYAFYRAWGYTPIIPAQVEDWSIYDPDRVPAWGTRCFTKPKVWWEEALSGDLIKVGENEPDDFAQTLHDIHKAWAIHCHKYINEWETHCRLVFFSKKAVNGFRFDNQYKVGEDTLMYFELKHAHMQGNLVMKHLFDRYPTYVYDTRIGGVVEEAKDENGTDRGFVEWLTLLVQGYDELELAGKMHEEKLPELKVHTYTAPEDTFNADDWDIIWPEGYRPDVMGLVNYPGKRFIKL